MLLSLLARNWWVILLRGLAAMAFGFLALTSTVAALATLVLFFGAWSLVDGVLTVAAAIQGRKTSSHWFVMLLSGLAAIFVAYLAFTYPLATIAALMLIIGVWAVIIGATQIVLAIRLRKEIQGELWMALGGLLSILFGLAAVGMPGLAAFATVKILGLYAVFFGIVLCLLAFKVKGLAPKPA